MRQRGRKQTLAVAQESSISAQERPEPPIDLTPEQRIEWIQVVNSLPATWFPQETLGVLAQYCKHCVTAKHVSELIKDLESQDHIDIPDYDRLLKMQERESRIMVSLATKMRMTQQATYHPEKTKSTPKVKSPWES